jgi:hypothetical protein
MLQIAVEGGAVHTGTLSGDIDVTPLQQDSPQAALTYYLYGLNLARDARCNRAVPLFYQIIATWPQDEVAVTRANDGLQLCQEADNANASPQPAP